MSARGGGPDYLSSSDTNPTLSYLKVKSVRIAQSIESIGPSESDRLGGINRSIASFFRLANAVSKNELSELESIEVHGAVSLIEDATSHSMERNKSLVKTKMVQQKGLDYAPYPLSISGKTVEKQNSAPSGDAVEQYAPVQKSPDQTRAEIPVGYEIGKSKKALSSWVESELNKAADNYIRETDKIERKFERFASDASSILIEGDRKLIAALPGIRDSIAVAIQAMDVKASTVLVVDAVAAVENIFKMQIVMMNGGRYENVSEIVGNLKGAQIAREISANHQEEGHKRLMLVLSSIENGSSKRAKQLKLLEDYVIDEVSSYLESAGARATVGV